MKKGAILALAGLMAASAAHATEPRAWAFGAASLFIADSTDWKSLPQTPMGNSITFEDINGGDWMSATHDLLGGTIALYNGRDSYSIFNIYADTTLTGPSTGGNPGSGYDYVYDLSDLLYATNLSDSVRLGVGVTWGNYINYIDDYNEPSTPNNYYKGNYYASVMGISLGSDLKEVGPLKVLQLGLQYHMYNNTYSEDYYSGGANTLNKRTLDNTRIALRVGGDLAGENGSFGRVELGYSMESSANKSAYQVAPATGSRIENKASGSNFNLGYAMGKSGEKGMILGGLNIVGYQATWESPNNYGNQDDYKYEEGSLDLVASAAGEASAFPWLTIRGGADAIILGGSGDKTTRTSALTPTNSYTDAYSYSDQSGANLNIGTTIKVGNFSFDGVINNYILQSGTYFLSGNSQDIWWATSVTYALGE